VIPAGLADAIRYVDGALAMLLFIACGWAIMISEHWDQRTRFGIFAGFSFALTGGHLTALGRPGTWWLVVLVVIVAVALASTIAYIRRELRERRVQ
jgi:hypothetical protein